MLSFGLVCIYFAGVIPKPERVMQNRSRSQIIMTFIVCAPIVGPLSGFSIFLPNVPYGS